MRCIAALSAWAVHTTQREKVAPVNEIFSILFSSNGIVALPRSTRELAPVCGVTPQLYPSSHEEAGPRATRRLRPVLLGREKVASTLERGAFLCDEVLAPLSPKQLALAYDVTSWLYPLKHEVTRSMRARRHLRPHVATIESSYRGWCFFVHSHKAQRRKKLALVCGVTPRLIITQHQETVRACFAGALAQPDKSA